MENVILTYNGLPVKKSTESYSVINDSYFNTGMLWKFDLVIDTKTLSFSYFDKSDFKEEDKKNCRPGYYQVKSFYKYKNGALQLDKLLSGTEIGMGFKHYFPINLFEENSKWGFKLGNEGDLLTVNVLFPKKPYNEYYYNKKYKFKIKNDPDINQPLRYNSPSDYPPVNNDLSSPEYSKVDEIKIDRSSEASERFYVKNFGEHISGWGVSDEQKDTLCIANIFICWRIVRCKEHIEKIAINTFQAIYNAFDEKKYNNNSVPYNNLPLCDQIVGEILLNWGYFYIHSDKTKFDIDPILPTTYSSDYESVINQYYNALVNFYINVYFRTSAQIFPNDTGTLVERSNRRIKYLIGILPSSAIGIIPVHFRIDILKMLVNNALYNKGELIALTIIKSITFQEADEFLGLLLSESVKWSNNNVTLFEALYRRIDDKILLFGSDNRKDFMMTMYILWFVSEYNPINSDTNTEALANTYNNKPVTIKYESELFFGFYMDNMNFIFNNQNIDAQEEKIEVVPTTKEFQSGVRRSWVTVGSYNIYQAITLNEYKEDNVAIKIPMIGLDASPNGETTALLPLFFLKYIDDKGDKEDLWTGIGLAFDIALTFTGIGNLSKLRHLRHLSKIGKVIRGTLVGEEAVFAVRSGYYALQGVAGAVELSASFTQIFLQYYTNGCQIYQQAVTGQINDNNPEGQIPEDPNVAYQRCKAIDNILFWMQMGSLGMDLVASKMIRKKAKQLKDLGYPAEWDLDQYLRLKTDINKLADVNVLDDYVHMMNQIPDSANIVNRLSNDAEKINFFNDFGMVQRDNAFWARLTANNGAAVDNWKQFRNLGITDEITNVDLLADAVMAPRYIAYYSNSSLKEAIAGLDRAMRQRFLDLHGNLVPLPSGPGFIKAWTKMTGKELGEFANNVPVLRQFDNMADDMIDNVLHEMRHADRGPGVRTLIKESPSDINNVMRPWLQDPAFAYAARDNTNARWQKWRRSIFAKHIFGLGRGFENLCTEGLLDKTSGVFHDVRQRILNATQGAKDIGNGYDFFPSIQLKIGNTENYFVADQLFVKYKRVGKIKVIEDIIVLETKLQTTTNLSPRQLEALQNASQGFNVRSLSSESRYNKNIEINPNSDKLIMPGGASPTFFKLFDKANGTEIQGITKLN